MTMIFGVREMCAELSDGRQKARKMQALVPETELGCGGGGTKV